MFHYKIVLNKCDPQQSTGLFKGVSMVFLLQNCITHVSLKKKQLQKSVVKNYQGIV